jgi:hypothetical protein
MDGPFDGGAPPDGDEVWPGATGDAQRSGRRGGSDTFAGPVRWIDQPGSLARRGISFATLDLACG